MFKPCYHPPRLSNITLHPQLQGLGHQHLQGGVSAEGQFELNPYTTDT